MRYLIVGPSWVGDMVMAQSLFKAIKTREPDAEIDVLAPAWSLPILKRMPEVRQGLIANFRHGEWAFQARRRLGRTLRKQYDKAIILPRSFKSVLVPYFAGIPQRVGFSGELRSLLLTDARRRRPTRQGRTITDKTVWRYLGLGASKQDYQHYQFDVPQPRLTVDQENQHQLFATYGLAAERPLICICPGAEYGPSKQWPLEYHRELTTKLLQSGHQVVILGGPKDQPAGDTICREQQGPAFNLCGQTQLIDVVDLAAAATAVISHDSGLMHVAAASGARVIAIYGSTSPDFTPPLTDNAEILVPHDLDCQPCFERTCRFGHYQCLRQTSVTQVMAALGIMADSAPTH